jgi:hypothetical protein
LALVFTSSIGVVSSGATTTTTLSPAGGKVVNLVVSPRVRLSLLDAAAAYHQLPPSDYTGLLANETYYAYDGATHRYYAAAGLVPSRSSQQAQIGTQDDGGYNLFTRAASATKWTVYNDGLGASSEATCPLHLPAALLAVWGWRKASCFPPI